QPTRSIHAIEDETDLPVKLRDAVALLEFLLTTIPSPSAAAGTQPIDLPSRIRNHEKLFGHLKEVLWAVGIRDRLMSTRGGQPSPEELDLETAAGVARDAVREPLPAVPRDVSRGVPTPTTPPQQAQPATSSPSAPQLQAAPSRRVNRLAWVAS